jgi:LysM repeat protein
MRIRFLILALLAIYLVENIGGLQVLDAYAKQVTSEPVYANPIQTAAPAEDGSIIHEVQPGENLYLIAQAYGIREADLIAMNDLGTAAVIFPGQRLLISIAFTATPNPAETSTSTPTRTLRPTQIPTKTPTPIPTRSSTPIPSSTPTPTQQPALIHIATTIDPVLLVIGFLALSGAVMMLVGTVLRGKG